jgi:hypothetical protein
VSWYSFSYTDADVEQLRTLVKNLTAQILVRDPTKRYPGAKFVQERKQSRLNLTICPNSGTFSSRVLQVFADATLVFPLLVAATFAQQNKL